MQDFKNIDLMQIFCNSNNEKTSIDDFDIEWSKSFLSNLKDLINTFFIPKYGVDFKINIQLGLFTNENYGSFKINFYDNENNLICFIIADTISGVWETFKPDEKIVKDQTAIDFLVEELVKINVIKKRDYNLVKEKINLAKEMEKSQINFTSIYCYKDGGNKKNYDDEKLKQYSYNYFIGNYEYKFVNEILNYNIVTNKTKIND